MTQKELLTFSKAQYSQQMTCALEKFFESNVCIKKGENRHPYADVLHEAIEGAKIEKYTEFEE